MILPFTFLPDGEPYRLRRKDMAEINGGQTVISWWDYRSLGLGIFETESYREIHNKVSRVHFDQNDKGIWLESKALMLGGQSREETPGSFVCMRKFKLCDLLRVTQGVKPQNQDYSAGLLTLRTMQSPAEYSEEVLPSCSLFLGRSISFLLIFTNTYLWTHSVDTTSSLKSFLTPSRYSRLVPPLCHLCCYRLQASTQQSYHCVAC